MTTRKQPKSTPARGAGRDENLRKLFDNIVEAKTPKKRNTPKKGATERRIKNEARQDGEQQGEGPEERPQQLELPHVERENLTV